MNEDNKKAKTPLYTKWWFWVIVVIVIIVFSSGDKTDKEKTETETNEIAEAEVTPEETEEPEITEPAFDKSACTEFDYKEYLRNPDSYEGNPVKATVKVLQVLDGGFFDSDFKYYRCCAYNKNAQYLSEDYDKIYIVNDYRGEGAEKILTDDVLEVYGTFDGVQEATYALTRTKDEFPAINMRESVRKN